MERWEVLNYIAKKINAKTYLEIGIDKGENIAQIKVDDRTGVDPGKHCPKGFISQTSDIFFQSNKKKYDLIFIDGYHEREQVKRDIANSLNALTSGGVIAVHDTNPKTKDRLDVMLQGNVWEAIWAIRCEMPGIGLLTADVDTGISIIHQLDGFGTEFKMPSWFEADWEFFDRYRKNILNLITMKELKNKWR